MNFDGQLDFSQIIDDDYVGIKCIEDVVGMLVDDSGNLRLKKIIDRLIPPNVIYSLYYALRD